MLLLTCKVKVWVLKIPTGSGCDLLLEWSLYGNWHVLQQNKHTGLLFPSLHSAFICLFIWICFQINSGLQLVETSCKLMEWHHLRSFWQEECHWLFQYPFLMTQHFVIAVDWFICSDSWRLYSWWLSAALNFSYIDVLWSNNPSAAKIS